jgi:molybdenum cofactor cytidylyltransferase
MANIGAVILAAGESSRLGQPKQLIRVQGKTLLRRVIDEAVQAGCTAIAVVIGNERQEIKNELRLSDIVLVENSNWRNGIGTSIRAGVGALINSEAASVPCHVERICPSGSDRDISYRSNVSSKRFLHSGRNAKIDDRTLDKKRAFLGAIVLLVCDQPFVDRDVIRTLIALRAKTGKLIVACGYAGTIGVPALFDRECFPELLALADNTGAKPIILVNPGRVAELPFPEGARDLDTIADFETLPGCSGEAIK